MVEPKKIDPSLSIYAAYSTLPVSAVADLTGALAGMSNRITSLHAELARVNPLDLPKLEVVTISTGESIKFTFGEGWMPSISTNNDDDIVIDVPKKLGVPIMASYLLLNGAQKGLDIQNKHLDNRLKEIEHQLKQTELQETLLSLDEQVGQLKREGEEIVTLIQQNEIYNVFEVNGVSILQNKTPSEDRSESD